MAETKNTEKQNIEIQKEEEKRESVRKADAAVKSMHDFTSPEVLYQELIKSEEISSVYRYLHDRKGL